MEEIVYDWENNTIRLVEQGKKQSSGDGWSSILAVVPRGRKLT